MTSSSTTTVPESQDSVFTAPKNYSLHLWIHLKPTADARQCSAAVANLRDLIRIVRQNDAKKLNEIQAGVGFGFSFYEKLSMNSLQNYQYKERSGPLGRLPNTGGDIFIHAKSNTEGILFYLAQKIKAGLPEGSVDKFEDMYGFSYRTNRDLSGFIDGTVNPNTKEARKRIAVEMETGGSYVVTMTWEHKMDVIAKGPEAKLEQWIGRTLEDSTSLNPLPPNSHVARMKGSTNPETIPDHQIYRQSKPYGNLHNKAGLLFVAYSASPDNFNFMLDQMVGASGGGPRDDLMLLSQCVASNYWYFPGMEELQKLQRSH